MPALMKSKVGSSAGINEELLTIVCPRSSKNFRNRRRISLLFMKLVQFLSYFVFRKTKACQSSVDSGCFSSMKRWLQFPVDHCSPENVLERRPLSCGDNLIGCLAGDSKVEKLRKNQRWMTVSALRHEISGESGIIEKSFIQQSLD